MTQCCVVPVPYREIEEALTHPVLRRKERVQKILWLWVVLPIKDDPTVPPPGGQWRYPACLACSPVSREKEAVARLERLCPPAQPSLPPALPLIQRVISMLQDEMKLIILDHYSQASEWAAKYIRNRIIQFNPGPDKYFTLGLPTGMLWEREGGVLRGQDHGLT